MWSGALTPEEEEIDSELCSYCPPACDAVEYDLVVDRSTLEEFQVTGKMSRPQHDFYSNVHADEAAPGNGTKY